VDIDMQQVRDDSEPDIQWLAEQYDQTVADLGSWIDQGRRNYDTRHCLWDGQSVDERKHGDKDTPAFPWEGASDLRPFVVDQIINADAALMCNSLFRANLAAVPVESGDAQRSAMVTAFMKWMVFSQMQEIRREAKLLANYVLEKGIGICGVFWETRESKRLRRITMEDIVQTAPELAEFISNPDMTGDVADLVQEHMPSISRRKARKMVTELRTKGETTIGEPVIEVNRPVIRAYSVDRDIYFPVGTTSFQDTPYIFKVDWYTPEQLRRRIRSDGWDKGWVEHVIETCRGEYPDVDVSDQWEKTYPHDRGYENMVKVVCAYWRGTDEDDIPAVYYTVFNPKVTENYEGKAYAIHNVLDYFPSRYPFVPFTRESINRRLLETRGIPEIAKGKQDEIKVQQDSRIDRTSLATCPPMEYPVGRPVAEWGPAARVPVRRRGEYGFAEIPKFDAGSIEIENRVEKNLRRYFGRTTDEFDMIESRAQQQDLISDWLGCWKIVFQQVWSLYKQYGPDEEYFRVIGAPADSPELFAKGDDNEKYDFYIDFDAINLDHDKVMEKYRAIAEIVSTYDKYGQTDWGTLLPELVAAIDPSIASRVIMPQDRANAKEILEEQNELAKIFAGMDVDVQPPVNAQLRLQVLQNYVTGSEGIPALDVQKRLQEDESFRMRLEKRQKQLQFVIMQQQNAVTGRLGAPAGNMTPNAGVPQ